jgi:DNA replication protein DnaC
MKTIDPQRSLAPTDALRERARRLGLKGLLTHWEEIAKEPWVASLVAWEEEERGRVSLERRITAAKIGAFKPMADFDWSWPKRIDRELVTDFFTFGFLNEGANAIVLGPNGVGKSMLAQNLAYQAVLRGHRVRYITASDMLSDLAAQDASRALARRTQYYANLHLLVIDEVGYLSFDSRYADLLFEVVSRRYRDGRSIVLTTNKEFAEWSTVFPNATCVVTLVDRLMHRAEILTIEGESYRLKEAMDRAAQKASARSAKRAPGNRASTSPTATP